MKLKLSTYIFLFFTILLLQVSQLKAQEKYFTRDGFISFFSTTPVEDIKANNSKVTCVLDIKTGKIEFAVLMKAFEFKKALMEEHFNENYVESNKFPKAIFKGDISNLDEIDFPKEGKYTVHIKGLLTIHGVSKEISASGNLEISKGEILLISEFNLIPEDYDIEIPGIVREKIAKEVLVSLRAKLAEFNR